jgi:competence protein ComEA
MPLVWVKKNREKRDETGGFLILLLAVLVIHGLMLLTRSGSSAPQESPCHNPVMIQIDGEVRSPGIYTCCTPPDLQALLKRACGPDGTLRPQAPWPQQTLVSGLKVLIQNDGTRYSISMTEMSAFTKMTLGLPISLNRETEEGLTALPGVGPVLARAIVQERDERGGFKALDEVKDVEGVGEMLLEKIRPFVIL